MIPVYGKSLYPRDFIIALNQSPAYFGAHRFFGDYSDPDVDSPYIIPLSADEVETIYEMENDLEQDIETIVPKTLQNAMMDFILTGFRHISRNRGEKMNKHHTMLVHISAFKRTTKRVQEITRNIVPIVEGQGDKPVSCG